MAFSFGGGATNTSAANPNNDVELNPRPADTVSSMAWSPQSFLATGAWDNKVRVYQIQAQANKITNAQAVASYDHQAPVLDVHWKKDGTQIFSGGCDNAVMMYDAASKQSRQIGQHGAPVKCCRYIEVGNISNTVVTGSWDKTLRYWDIRTPKQVMQVQLPERCYCLDTLDNLMVVATANRRIQIFDLNKPQQPFKKIESPLKYQSRCIACFKDKKGFAVGSIEGRVAIHHVEDRDKSKNFAFKCHRINNSSTSTSDVYPVNSIAFHTFGTFATAGADGGYNFWDKDSKQRLKAFKRGNQPITCSAWNANGTLYAYGVGYDWHKGSGHHNPTTATNHIMVHQAQEVEIKPRPPKR